MGRVAVAGTDRIVLRKNCMFTLELVDFGPALATRSYFFRSQMGDLLLGGHMVYAVVLAVGVLILRCNWIFFEEAQS